VETAFARMHEGFAHLEALMTGDSYAVGDAVPTADCVLFPVLFFMGVFGQAFDKGDPLAGHGKVAGYWPRIQQDPAAQKVLGELRTGLRHLGGR
jgi:glutathione S-transferase